MKENDHTHLLYRGPDWLMTTPPMRSGDPLYPVRVTIRNTNTRIGGYLGNHTFTCRPIPTDEPRYFRTCEPIAHAICVLANDDTRRFYAAQIAGSDNDTDRDFWTRYRDRWEGGY